jgi:hypothetical protein
VQKEIVEIVEIGVAAEAEKNGKAQLNGSETHRQKSERACVNSLCSG